MRSHLLWLAAFTGIAFAQVPPDPERQQRVLQTVNESVRGYVAHLPDFTCIRTTQHYLAKASVKDWHLQVKVDYELGYYGQQEHYRVVAVDGAPKNKVSMWTMAAGWVETNGNFGWIVSQLFDSAVHPDFEWQGWDYVHGKRAMVFRYHVALADSQARSGKCMSWIVFTNCKSVKYSFHGQLFVDAATFDLLRITHVPEDLPPSYAAGSTFVDYGQVTVAGREYLLPIADHFEDSGGKTLFRNDSTYRDYRRFTAESTLRTTPTALSETSAHPAAVKIPEREAAPVQAADCFEARDRVARSKPSPLMRAMVTAAFDDRRQAGNELRAVIRRSPDSEEAAVAHAELSAILERSGEISSALEHAAQAAAGDPERHSRQAAPGLLEALAKYPPLTVVSRGYARLPYAHARDGMAITISVNGKSGEFVLDTGAGISSISEAHAVSLGVMQHADQFTIEDIAGKPVECRLGIAAQLGAGAFLLRNVPFCVASTAAPDILGLPVLLAFETVRWSRDGAFEIGLPSARRNLAQANVCFEGGELVVQALLGSHPLPLNLDTGNDRTFLYPDFSEDFAETAKSAGAHHTFEIEGIGHSIELTGAELPEIRLRVGGADAVLRDVAILAEPLPSQCPGCLGNAGRDLLAGARRVTLDFKAMRLTLEQ